MSKDPAVLDALMKAAYKKIMALEAEVETLRAAPHAPIAIVGMGCRFPGAENPEEFWAMISEGRDGVAAPLPTRWRHSATPPTAEQASYIGGFLAQVDDFDPLFFRISPREALHMDPEHRLLLEVTWEALEHAGIPPHTVANSQTGVFIGQISGGQVAPTPVEGGATDGATTGDGMSLDHFYAMTGTLSGFAAGRLSHFLGAQGPSLAIDCSCSAALMGVHLAVNSLRRGECSLAITGGVHLLPTPEIVGAFAQWQLVTADGRCKSFDAAANGYGLGEGCGIVVLKRLADAQRDGDRILAVIKGSATNHDGPSSGLTVPNGRAQQAVVQQALADAGVAPEAVSYLEANGIGTPLGDTMEADAMGHVFGGRTQPLWLGAVAPNIGHLDAAAGVSSLIKAVLALYHGEIPPMANFHTPNPLIDWDALPFRVPTTRIPWPTPSRIAGVSSFGLNGSNVHLVLAQPAAGPADDRPSALPLHLLTLSAKNEEALRALATRYQQHLAAHPVPTMSDLCYTTNTGRTHFSHRAALVTNDGADLSATLAALAAGQRKPTLITGRAPESRPKIVFLCSGLGAQSVDMGRQLYDTLPVFRQAMERCDELLRPYLGVSILDVLYPGREVAAAQRYDHATTRPHDQALLQRSLYAETALFALEYALAQVWQAWGVALQGADVVIGHSVGEYVAACLAGVISLEDGLRLVAERARLIESASTDGATAAIFGQRQQVETLLAPYGDRVTLAGINSPDEILIAGEATAVDAVLAAGKAAGLDGRRLGVAHAAHSPRMDRILDAFQQMAATVTYQEPQIKLISSVDGAFCRQLDATYWRAHLRQPVRFDQAIQTLQNATANGQPTVVIELGPQPVLLWLGRQNWTGGADIRWLASLRSVQTDWQQMVQSLAELYVQGAPVDWQGFAGGQRRKIMLPTYPFQRERYAPPPPQPTPVWESQAHTASTPSLPARSAELTSKPVWGGSNGRVDEPSTPPAPSARLGGDDSSASMALPGLPLAIEAFQMRRLPTTSDEWWYHAKQVAPEQWQVQILDGAGNCIAETRAATMPTPQAGRAKVGADNSQSARLPADHPQHTLPNGLTVAHLNPYETAYVYKEIFVDRCYLKHGITLQRGATVVDIGANIGLFSLFVQQEAPGAHIYAFEPSPAAFRALQINAGRHVPGAKVFNCGIADAAQMATFTFYPNSSVFSSFHADADADGAAIRTVVENMVRGQQPHLDAAELASLVDELMIGRMASQRVACQLYALSDIIAAEGIDRIDMLKIDAEKSEVAILRGIRTTDWPKIQQIVIEVHEQGGALLEEVTSLLQQQGFSCAVEEETFLHKSGLYNVFATRGSAGVRAQHIPLSLRQQLLQATASEQNARLIDYLRGVIAQVAGIDARQLDVDTTLIALGVDSLLAIEIRNQIKQSLAVTLPIATVLENSLTRLARLLLEQADLGTPQSPPVAQPAPAMTPASAPATPLPAPAAFQEIEGEL